MYLIHLSGFIFISLLCLFYFMDIYMPLFGLQISEAVDKDFKRPQYKFKIEQQINEANAPVMQPCHTFLEIRTLPE